jgi:hypothetical protein
MVNIMKNGNLLLLPTFILLFSSGVMAMSVEISENVLESLAQENLKISLKKKFEINHENTIPEKLREMRTQLSTFSFLIQNYLINPNKNTAFDIYLEITKNLEPTEKNQDQRHFLADFIEYEIEMTNIKEKKEKKEKLDLLKNQMNLFLSEDLV